MLPILMSIAGALAGKAVVSAVEWMAEDKPAPGAVVKSDVRGLGFSPDAAKISISAAGQQKSLSARYDPSHLSPQRLGNLADELKANGSITPADHQLLMRVVSDARQADITAKSGNRFLTSKDMVAELDRLADLQSKAGNQAVAAQYQKLSNLLKDMKPKPGNATAAINAVAAAKSAAA